MMSLARARLWLPLFLSVGACTGQVTGGGVSGVTGSGASTGSSTGTATGTSTGTGTAGSGILTGAAGAADVPPPAGTDPGRVTVHRLNRVEYNNTVRDLLGTTARPADTFPPDDRGEGFDNISDILTLSPVHLQLYQNTAESLITAALATGSAQRAKILTCDLATMGDTCARTILRSFARRAWRRPVLDTEVDKLMTTVTLARTNGDSYEVGVSLALQAIMISANFVFRIEIDPMPTSLTPHLLTSHEIASRLSYFLWSSMPDDALFAAADAGTLTDKTQLQTQVTRMLKDPKAQALVDNFGGQWLYTRMIDEVQPDAKVFPTFDTALRSALKQETYMMLKDIFCGIL